MLPEQILYFLSSLKALVFFIFLPLLSLFLHCLFPSSLLALFLLLFSGKDVPYFLALPNHHTLP